MRKIIAAAAVLAVTSLHAAEQLKFGDVNYFLKQGQVNFAVDWSETWNEERFENLSDRYRTRGNMLESRAAYAINDQLNLFVGVDYAFQTKTELPNVKPKPKSSMTEGFSNPSLGANFRLLKQADAFVNLDFGAVAKVYVGEDQRIGAPGKGRSTLTDARNSLELNSRIGRKWNEANEWQLAGGLFYKTAGNAKVGGQSEKREFDDSFDVFVRGTYQYRPVNEFMMLLSAQATRVGELKYDDGPVAVTQTSHIDMDFRFTAKYLVTENFITKFNYGQTRLSEVNLQKDGASDVRLNGRRSNFWGIGFDFLF